MNSQQQQHNDDATVPLVTALDYLTQAWDRGFACGQASPPHEETRAAHARVVTVVGIVLAVGIAIIALTFIAAVVAGYLDGAHAFDALKSSVTR